MPQGSLRFAKPMLLALLALAASGFLGARPGWNTARRRNHAADADTSEARAVAGKVIYKENCGACHFSASTQKKIGPGLKALYKREKFADGKKVDDAGVRRWIEKGGKEMPPFGDSLSGEQIRDLIAYLKTL